MVDAGRTVTIHLSYYVSSSSGHGAILPTNTTLICIQLCPYLTDAAYEGSFASGGVLRGYIGCLVAPRARRRCVVLETAGELMSTFFGLVRVDTTDLLAPVNQVITYAHGRLARSSSQILGTSISSREKYSHMATVLPSEHASTVTYSSGPNAMAWFG
eukprot:1181354-Prorocentrum_minimum.AAC.1